MQSQALLNPIIPFHLHPMLEEVLIAHYRGFLYGRGLAIPARYSVCSLNLLLEELQTVPTAEWCFWRGDFTEMRTCWQVPPMPEHDRCGLRQWGFFNGFGVCFACLGGCPSYLGWWWSLSRLLSISCGQPWKNMIMSSCKYFSGHKLMKLVWMRTICHHKPSL